MLFSEKKLNPREYSPLALAYIGDTFFDLFVRTKIIEQGNRRVTDMHRRAVNYVRAASQARIVNILEDILTEEERDVIKWGRNAKVNTHPKGATLSEYHLATGFEALLGYLYLSGREERLREILNTAYTNFDEE